MWWLCERYRKIKTAFTISPVTFLFIFSLNIVFNFVFYASKSLQWFQNVRNIVVFASYCYSTACLELNLFNLVVFYSSFSCFLSFFSQFINQLHWSSVSQVPNRKKIIVSCLHFPPSKLRNFNLIYNQITKYIYLNTQEINSISH